MNKSKELILKYFNCSEFEIDYLKDVTPIKWTTAIALIKKAMETAYTAGRAEGHDGRFSNVMNGYRNFDEWFNMPDPTLKSNDISLLK